MNIFSTTRLLRWAVLAGALILPVASWADDHLLSINGTAVTTPAIVPHTGILSQPLTLTSFDGNTPLVFGAGGQGLTVVTALVKMCKPGTRGQLEWLDQGNTVVGVTGRLTTATTFPPPLNTYRLTLGMASISDTYASSNGSCTTAGAKTYTYTVSAVIDKQNVVKLTSTYNFWNVNSVPEPGTISLLLIGLLGLGWLSMNRIRQTRGAAN